jgi:hypothetical protein
VNDAAPARSRAARGEGAKVVIVAPDCRSFQLPSQAPPNVDSSPSRSSQARPPVCLRPRDRTLRGDGRCDSRVARRARGVGRLAHSWKSARAFPRLVVTFQKQRERGAKPAFVLPRLQHGGHLLSTVRRRTGNIDFPRSCPLFLVDCRSATDTGSTRFGQPAKLDRSRGGGVR